MNRRVTFILLALAFAVVIALTYSNHFRNSFHFDDSHVIQQNLNIRTIDIAKFFTDATTFSALPANQSYRPFLVTLFAIWYKLGSGQPFWFHVGAFACYMLLWMLLIVFFQRIFVLTSPNNDHGILSLMAASFYVLHAANAETVNYISAGSDLVSTTLMVMALVIYANWPRMRKYGIYLVPALLAMFTKETSAAFPLFLAAYILFENQVVGPSATKPRPPSISHSLRNAIPATLICLALLYLCQEIVPKTFLPSSHTRLEYVLAQPFVVLHYFITFFLPFNLSADTDWETIKNIFDDRFVVGVVFLSVLVVGAIKAWKKNSTRPIAFGILWFLIGVMPTSSGVVILSEVMNDHRMFLPFIGLSIALGWSVALFLQRMASKTAGLLAVLALMSCHAFGTFQRNKVWHNEETLWYDVTQKSPKNGRGLMNYGLSLMARGDIQSALFWFERALHLSPNYPYLHINVAIAHGALGDSVKAEDHFKKAIALSPQFHGCYYYYARFLDQLGRPDEALPLLSKALELGPGFIESRYLLMAVNAKIKDWKTLHIVVEETLKLAPNDDMAKSFQKMLKSINNLKVAEHRE